MKSFLKELNEKRQCPRDLRHIIDHLTMLETDLKSGNTASALVNGKMAKGLAVAMQARILSSKRIEDKLQSYVKKLRGKAKEWIRFPYKMKREQFMKDQCNCGMNIIYGQRYGSNEIPCIHQCLCKRSKKLEIPGGWYNKVDLFSTSFENVTFINDYDWDLENKRIKNKNINEISNGSIKKSRYIEEEEEECYEDLLMTRNQDDDEMEDASDREWEESFGFFDNELDYNHISTKLFGMSLCYHLAKIKNIDLPHAIAVVSRVMIDHCHNFDAEILDSVQKGMIISDVWKRADLI